MKPLRILSASEQAARYLRDELQRGTWSKTMPGEDRLVAQLGVGRDTIKMALKHLEKEGLLVGQGAGRRRRIASPELGIQAPVLRIAVMVFDFPDRHLDFMVELRRLLTKAGYLPFYPDKTLLELGMDPKKVASFVQKTQANAWVVLGGSREVLTWFAAQDTPAFALAGKRRNVPIAGTGPDKSPALAEVTRLLIKQGHSRISLLVRKRHRLPKPGKFARAFLGELEDAGTTTGAFNLPDWEESRDGFERILDSLFESTPPTALILDESHLYHAAYHYLTRRNLRVPDEVSMICTEQDPSFAWCQPSIAYVHWDRRQIVRRVVTWLEKVALGKDDRRQSNTKAKFVNGGTVGPAPTLK